MNMVHVVRIACEMQFFRNYLMNTVSYSDFIIEFPVDMTARGTYFSHCVDILSLLLLVLEIQTMNRIQLVALLV